MGRKDQLREFDGETAEHNPSNEILDGEGSGMGKEVKIGLGVIVVLLGVFGGVLFYRLDGSSSESIAKEEAATATSSKASATAAKKPAAPTVLTATDGRDSRSTKPSVADMAKWGSSSSHRSPESRSFSDRQTAADRSSTGQSSDSRSSRLGHAAPPSRMPRTSAAGGFSDPFQGRSGSSKSSTIEVSDTSIPPAPSPAGEAFADSDTSTPTTSADPNQAGIADASVPPSNPLRGSSNAGFGSRGGHGLHSPPSGFGRSHSDAPAEITASEPGGGDFPAASPIIGSEGRSRSGYRNASESPAYGSQYSAPSSMSRGGASDSSPSYGSAGSRIASSPYGAGNAYGMRSGSGNSSLLGSASISSEPTQRGNKYVIQPNDSYWTISQQLYGSGAYYQALAEHNRKIFPDSDRLQAGKEISTPSLAELEKAYPKLCPAPEHRDVAKRPMSTVSTPVNRGGRVYVVQEGDTLFDIARYELGKASRWAEIYELNRDTIGKDFDHLRAGMQLTLPHEPSPGKVTVRPDDVFQR